MELMVSFNLIPLPKVTSSMLVAGQFIQILFFSLARIHAFGVTQTVFYCSSCRAIISPKGCRAIYFSFRAGYLSYRGWVLPLLFCPLIFVWIYFFHYIFILFFRNEFQRKHWSQSSAWALLGVFSHTLELFFYEEICKVFSQIWLDLLLSLF